MASSIWRISHLIIAIISSAFLLSASVTGGIIAVDNCLESAKSPVQKDIGSIDLAQIIPVLQKKYAQVNVLEVNASHEVVLEAIDDNGAEINSVINPTSGAAAGKPKKESAFIKQITSFHRSLFLHETGRLIVGIIAFLLLLMALSGLALILKRQGGIANFFNKISREHLPQYLHVVSGRLMLIPLIIISGSGTFLFLKRFKLLPKEKNYVVKHHAARQADAKKIADLEIFRAIKLSDVKKIEFPFSSDDPEDIFILKLSDREIEVRQGNGEIIKETRYPWSTAAYNLSYSLHTGKSSGLWSLVLAASSGAILLFIYSGFAITFKRKKPGFKNKFALQESDLLLLYGSESGDTYTFAQKIYSQFLALGRKVYLGELNAFTPSPCLRELIIFTSTYGDGDAPANAEKFLSLLAKNPPQAGTKYSVVGFGSDFYENFCGFAKNIEKKLEENTDLQQVIPIFTVNQSSAVDFTLWVRNYNEATGSALRDDAPHYLLQPKKREKIIVISKTQLSANGIFTITFRKNRRNFVSGDILTVFPTESIERQYSIGRIGNDIQLFVKLHDKGIGSSYLYGLKPGDSVQAYIQKNPSFHFPKDAKDLIMIANGTGIAPFLGMLKEQHKNTKKHLYCGFRHNCTQTTDVEGIMQKNIIAGRLESYKSAFSRGSEPKYVTDLLREDISFLSDKIRGGAVVMVCGSTAMQKDVELILNNILTPEIYPSIAEMRAAGKLLTDCY